MNLVVFGKRNFYIDVKLFFFHFSYLQDYDSRTITPGPQLQDYDFRTTTSES